jgi:hypothetical protein
VKAWAVIAKTDDVGDVFCVDCDCRTPTPVFVANAEEIDGLCCDGCGAVFSAEDMEWNPVYECSAVDELKEASGYEEA